MFYRLNPKGGKLPGKMVVLTHDIAHRSVGSQDSSQESHYNLDLIYELQNYDFRPGGDRDAQQELIQFLTLAKEKGYEFRTVDTYLTD